MMRKWHLPTAVLVSLFLIYALPTVSAAEQISLEQRVKKSLTQGMADLSVKAGSPDLCVLTNAPYVKHGKQSAIVCLDEIQQSTGCSQAKKNLLSYHAAVSKPLRIVLFRKDSGDGVVLTLCSDGDRLTSPCSPVAAAAPSERFDRVKIRMGVPKILEPEAFKEVMEKIGPSDAFSIVSIANSWAAGAPFDFLKACEFHNHYCPGVMGGYLIVAMIKEKYPLEKGERYVWIGAPPKCGDDGSPIFLGTVHA